MASELSLNTRLSKNPAAVYLFSLRVSGQRTMRQALNKIAWLLSSGAVSDCLAFSWPELRYEDTAAVKAKLVLSYKPATVNKFLAALRGVLRECWRLGLMSAEDYGRAVDVASVKVDTLPAGRSLQSGELAALMAECEGDNGPAGVRDGAIIALMYAVGARRQEVSALQVGDYQPDTGRLVIRGKGGKERTAFLDNGAYDALGDWLRVRGGGPGALFLAINKGGRVLDHGLVSQSLYDMLARRAEGAHVRSFSPHDMRRSFVGDMLDAGVDISTVARIAGHASVVTTARYDRRGDDAKRKAAGVLHVPYRKRG